MSRPTPTVLSVTLHQLLSCLLDFHEIRYRIFCKKSIKREFCEKSAWRQIGLHFTWRNQWISTHALHVYSSDLGVKVFLLYSLHFSPDFDKICYRTYRQQVIKRLRFCDVRRSGSRFIFRVDKWTLFIVSTLIFRFGRISVQILAPNPLWPVGFAKIDGWKTLLFLWV
jgi:hypothetical protein